MLIFFGAFFFGILSWYLVPLLLFWHYISAYAEIEVPRTAERLFVKDDITFTFLDVQYFAKYRADQNHINAVLAHTPSWSKEDWKQGRQTNLSEFFEINDNGEVYSIASCKGESVYRILTVDKKNRIVYFEMREF